jgi:hypothetical protein
MKTQLSPRDWQQLSDFLDNQLNPREKADLEKRLVERADLRTGLEELKQTRAVLQAAPHRRAPRNFTLKPEMIPARRKAWQGWTPTFSFASVATALVAGVMLLGQVFPMGKAVPMMAAAPVSAPQAAISAEDASQATPMIITWGDQSPAGMGEGGGGGYGGGAPETALNPSAGKATEPTQVAAMPTAMPVEELRPQPTPTSMPVQPQPEPTQGPLTLAPAVSSAESTGTENLILGIPPTEEQGQIQAPATITVESQREAQPIDWRPWVTGGLFGVAVLFAVLAIRLRRR